MSLINNFCLSLDTKYLRLLDYDTKKFFMLVARYVRKNKVGNQKIANLVIYTLTNDLINLLGQARDPLIDYYREHGIPGKSYAIIAQNYEELAMDDIIENVTKITGGCKDGESPDKYLKEILMLNPNITSIDLSNCIITPKSAEILLLFPQLKQIIINYDNYKPYKIDKEGNIILLKDEDTFVHDTVFCLREKLEKMLFRANIKIINNTGSIYNSWNQFFDEYSLLIRTIDFDFGSNYDEEISVEFATGFQYLESEAPDNPGGTEAIFGPGVHPVARKIPITAIGLIKPGWWLAGNHLYHMIPLLSQRLNPTEGLQAYLNYEWKNAIYHHWLVSEMEVGFIKSFLDLGASYDIKDYFTITLQDYPFENETSWQSIIDEKNQEAFVNIILDIIFW